MFAAGVNLIMTEPQPMKEIHRIREKLYKENKSLSRKQHIEKVTRIAQQMKEKYGFKIQQTRQAA